jgi:hypothetical protein
VVSDQIPAAGIRIRQPLDDGLAKNRFDVKTDNWF